MTVTLIIKTGSSGVLSMTHEKDSGEPIDITSYGIDMDFYNRDTGNLIISTSIGDGITLTDPGNGKYQVDPGPTIDWPIGSMPIDIKYSVSGVPQHTETFNIEVEEGISQ